MRLIIAILMFPLAAVALDPDRPVARVVNGEVIERRQSLPTSFEATYPYRNAEYRWLSDGWRQWYGATCAEGIVTQTVSSVTATSVTDIVWCGAAADQTPQPSTFPEGIEVPWVTILSSTNQVGWLYVALDDGTLVPILAHNSPWPSQAEINRRIESARTNAIAARQQRIATTRDIATKAAAATSVPALRAEVRRLAELLERD